MFIRTKNSYININAIAEICVDNSECYLKFTDGDRRSIVPQEAIESLVALEANGLIINLPWATKDVTDWRTGEDDLPPSLRIDA